MIRMHSVSVCHKLPASGPGKAMGKAILVLGSVNKVRAERPFESTESSNRPEEVRQVRPAPLARPIETQIVAPVPPPLNLFSDATLKGLGSSPNDYHSRDVCFSRQYMWSHLNLARSSA